MCPEQVLKFGDDAPYTVQATLEFDEMSSFHKAAQHETAKEVMGDIVNFSDKDPILLPGEVVKTS